MTSGSSDITSNTYYGHIQLAAVKLINLEKPAMPLMGTFTFLSASEGKVKLEQSPPSCLPVNKSQKSF